MDLPLWELPYGESHLASFESIYHVEDIWQCGHDAVYDPVATQSSYDVGDQWMCDFSFGYWRDTIEEDSLNEKSCLQVLRILMDKADKEILDLEEDIVMLQCQLAWDDEDWSKQCSVALNEKIDRLDILIQSLKNEITEDAHNVAVQIEQPEKLAQSLQDLVKPLLENYLIVKSKQTESSNIHMPVLPADELSKKKSDSSTSEHNKEVEKKCINLLKENERKKLSIEIKERKINHPQQKQGTIISKLIANAHTSATDKLSEKDNKLNRLKGKKMPNSAPVKSRRSSIKLKPDDPKVKASSASTSIEKPGSRERDERKRTDKEVMAKAKVTQDRLEYEKTVTNSHLESRGKERKIAETVKPADETLEMGSKKRISEASIKTRKARTYRRAINKNVLPTKPLVEIKRKRTNFPETTEAVETQGIEMNDTLGLFNLRTKYASRENMKLEHKNQVQQTHEIETTINQAKSISSFKPEKINMESSSIENLTGQQKFEVLKKMSKYGKNETQQESSGIKIEGASKVNTTSISLPLKKRKLAFTSQTIRETKSLGNLLIKSAEMDYDASSSIAEKAIDNSGVVNVPPQNSSQCIKDVERLTLNDLKIIAKNQKLPGYYKLRKQELQKRLGLEPLDLQIQAYERRSISPANTI